MPNNGYSDVLHTESPEWFVYCIPSMGLHYLVTFDGAMALDELLLPRGIATHMHNA